MSGVDGLAVLVTGAANAVGRALSQDLAAHGAKVLVTDVDDEHGAQTVTAITATGGTAAYRRTDVRDEAQVVAAVGAVVEAYGQIDGLVNNAGTELPVAVVDATLEDLRGVLDTNLVGTFLCLKHAALAMRAAGSGGAVVNISSVTSDLTASVGNGLYATSKGGVDALTKAAAVELAPEGISVNALAFIAADVPDGMFQRFLAATGESTDAVLASIPARRMVSPAELGAVVRFLLSPDARYMVGRTVVMDGGFTSV